MNEHMTMCSYDADRCSQQIQVEKVCDCLRCNVYGPRSNLFNLSPRIEPFCLELVRSEATDVAPHDLRFLLITSSRMCRILP